jgi:hypothetical protein
MDNSLLFFQQKMEEFYRNLVDVMIQNGSCLWTDSCEYEEFIDDHDLLVFEDALHGMPYDDSNELLLKCLVKKGYEILMNFQGNDVLLGNVVVKLGDKWFAFGECKNDSEEGYIVTQIWPLKYVVPRMRLMEASPNHMISITHTKLM